jgi:hypothetical protein
MQLQMRFCPVDRACLLLKKDYKVRVDENGVVQAVSSESSELTVGISSMQVCGNRDV